MYDQRNGFTVMRIRVFCNIIANDPGTTCFHDSDAVVIDAH